MFELVKLFPRRPLAVTIASWMFFFVLQIVALTATIQRPARYDSCYSHLEEC